MASASRESFRYSWGYPVRVRRLFFSQLLALGLSLTIFVFLPLLGGVASDATRQTLARAASSQQLIALTLGSPEFQRR